MKTTNTNATRNTIAEALTVAIKSGQPILHIDRSTIDGYGCTHGLNYLYHVMGGDVKNIVHVNTSALDVLEELEPIAFGFTAAHRMHTETEIKPILLITNVIDEGTTDIFDFANFWVQLSSVYAKKFQVIVLTDNNFAQVLEEYVITSCIDDSNVLVYAGYNSTTELLVTLVEEYAELKIDPVVKKIIHVISQAKQDSYGDWYIDDDNGTVSLQCAMHAMFQESDTATNPCKNRGWNWNQDGTLLYRDHQRIFNWAYKVIAHSGLLYVTGNEVSWVYVKFCRISANYDAWKRSNLYATVNEDGTVTYDGNGTIPMGDVKLKKAHLHEGKYVLYYDAMDTVCFPEVKDHVISRLYLQRLMEEYPDAEYIPIQVILN